MPSVFLFDDGESTNTILCHGGTGNIPLTIFPNEGFTYEWRNSGGTLVSTDRDLMSVPADTYTIKLFKNGNNSSWNFTLTDPSAMNITLTPSLFTGGFNISYSGGHDGTIACTVQGGAPSYYYQWSNGNYLPSIGNLYAGTYSVTVTDAMGCTATSSSMTLTAPTPLHVTYDTSSHHGFAVSCNGGNDGAINLTVSGGVSPYSYNWNDGIYTKDRTSLAAGTHTVIVDDANPGARDTLHITLHQPSAISITMASPLHPNGYNTSCYNCKDGKITASASGGISGYTYLWNTGKIGNEIDSLIKGMDTVTVTDNNGCKMKKSFEVTGDIEGWKIGGNANIDTNMQFMGTKDSIDVILKTNGKKRMTVKANGTIEMNSPLKIFHDTTSTTNYRPVYAHDDGTLDFVGSERPCQQYPIFPWFNMVNTSTCEQFNPNDIFLGSNFRNVGIGKNNPTAKLHISGGNLKIDNLNGTGNRFVLADATGVLITSSMAAPWEIQGNSNINDLTDFLGTTTSADLVIKTQGQENMRISKTTGMDFGGHIGIHTAPAPSKFVTTRNNGMLLLDGVQSSLLFGNETGNITLNPYGQFGIEYLENANPKLAGLNFWKPYLSEPWGLLNNLLFISNIGNVGISSSRPYGQFQINDGISKISMGSIPIYESLKYISSYIGFNVARDNDQAKWVFDTDGGSNGGSAIIGDVGGGLRFVNVESSGGTLSNTKTDGDMLLKTMMTIRPDGKVGIGTSTGSEYNGDYKLYVIQGIRTQKIKVDAGSDWADFVFKKDYILPSLSDVKDFIDSNGHLPEIPSASEVTRNGIDIAQMDCKLLMKIEELTLYVIQLQEEINKIKEKQQAK